MCGYVIPISCTFKDGWTLLVGGDERVAADMAKLLAEDDPRERQRWLRDQLPASASNAAAVRFFGTQLLTVRIDLDA